MFLADFVSRSIDMQGIKVCQGFRQDFALQTPRPRLTP